MKPRSLLLTAAGLIAAGIAWFAWPRAKPPGSAGPTPRQLWEELLPPLPPVADEENGWVLSQKLPKVKMTPESKRQELVIYPEEVRFDDIPGVNRELLEEYKRDNATLLSEARRILQIPGWQRILPPDEAADVLSEANDQRMTFPARVILANAIALAQDGKLPDAWPDVLAILRLGRRIVESQGNWMDYLAGCTFLTKGARAAALAGQQAHDSAVLRRLAGDLLPFEDNALLFAPVLDGLLTHLLRIYELYRSRPDKMQRDRVVMLVGPFADDEFFDARVDEVLQSPDPKVKAHLEQWLAVDWCERGRTDAAAYRRLRGASPATWAAFLEKYFPSHDPAQRFIPENATDFDTEVFLPYSRIFEVTARIRLARVCLLLRAWMVDHGGELPGSLNYLVPDYLPALPLDPFNGQPLRYDKVNLWSVGANLKEDAEERREKDIVLPL